MGRTVQARLDARSEADLALLRNEGRSDSAAIRVAFHEAAELGGRRSAVRLEAQATATDPADRPACLSAENVSQRCAWARPGFRESLATVEVGPGFGSDEVDGVSET